MENFRSLINLIEYTEQVDSHVRFISEQTEKWMRNNLVEYDYGDNRSNSRLSDIRQLNKGPKLPERPDKGENPHGDLSDKVNQTMGFRKKPNRGASVRQNSNIVNYDFSQNGQYGEKLKQYVEKFFDQARSQGYTPELFTVKGLGLEPAIVTTNGIKVKMALGKTGNKTMFYFSCPNKDIQEKVKQELLSNDFNLGNGERNFVGIIPSTSDFNQSLSEFWKLTDIIEEMGSDFHSSRKGSTKGKIKTPQTPFKYYIGAASLIFVATRFSLPHLLPRGGKEDGSGTFDIKDSLITVGYTEGAKSLMEIGEKPYREHAVPCKVIIDVAIDMYQDKNAFSGSTIDFSKIAEVAKMIQRNLVIILTDKATETSRIDKQYLSSMPSGWDPFTGDVLARFEAVSPPIAVYPISGNSRLN